MPTSVDALRIGRYPAERATPRARIAAADDERAAGQRADRMCRTASGSLGLSAGASGSREAMAGQRAEIAAGSCQRVSWQPDCSSSDSSGRDTREAHHQRAIQHHLHPRRPGARPVDRRHHHADLSRRRPTCRTALGRHKGFEYARTQNPTRARARGQHRRHRRRPGGVRVRLGHGGHRRDRQPCSPRAITSSSPTTPTAARSGCSTRCCAGTSLTFTLRRHRRPRRGRAARFTPTTKLLFVETPTNPVLDHHRPGGGRRARAPPRRCGWSSTTRSPARASSGRSSSAPTSSLHSTTKYLNGHSDSVGGVVVAVRDDDIEWLKFVQNAAGAILSPFDSWLVLRGTKTLSVRMAQHNANGLALAEFLAAHPQGAARLLPGACRRIRSTRWRRGR